MSHYLTFLIFLLIPLTTPMKLHKTFPIGPMPAIPPLNPPQKTIHNNSITKENQNFLNGFHEKWLRFKSFLMSDLLKAPNNTISASMRFFWLLLFACLTIFFSCLVLNWLLVLTKWSRLELNRMEKDENFGLNTLENE